MSQPRTWAGSSLLATHGRGFSPWGWPQMAGTELAVVALPAEIDLANAEAVSMNPGWLPGQAGDGGNRRLRR